MENTFKAFSEKHLKDFKSYLLSHVEEVSETDLEAAMNYSLDAEGKRLRPLLLLGVLAAFNEDVKKGYPAASALEMIHTYSLIHDDLPAMDNDELRRGKPTNHIQFNESTAILAGDALLTLAFEVITLEDLPAETKVKLVTLLAEASGYKGMVGGQQADIDGEEADLTLTEIESIHLRKTGGLIKMATVAGGLIAEKSSEILVKLETLAEEIGIAYQIRDDILDVVATEEELGKGVATDAALGKSTYPSLLGLEGAFDALEERLNKAGAAIAAISKLEEDFQPELLFSFVNQLALEEYQ
jgi:geranylgeranyl diphosphate synthase type II